MSWEALDWAGKQRTRACSTQVVLYVLANAADPDGVAMGWWTRDEHWWQYLIDRTRLKRASLFRIIGELKDAGALALEWREPADGGRKRAIVRLNLACRINEDAAEGESTTETPAALQSPIPQAVESTTEITSREPVHHVDPIESTSETCSYTNPKKNPVSPPTPLRGDLSPTIDDEAKASFERFRRERVPFAIEDEPRCLAIWAKLTPADRDIRIAAIAEWVAEQKRLRKTSTPLAAHRWLGDGSPNRQGRWQGYWAQAQGRGAGTAQAGSYDRSSPEGKAILTLYRIARAPKPLEIQGKLRFRHEVTPQLLALAQAPPEYGRKEGDEYVLSPWDAYALGSRHFGAWRDLLHAFGLGLTSREIRAPWPFPPSVDGKIYTVESTGPPEEFLTESDEEFMAGHGI